MLFFFFFLVILFGCAWLSKEATWRHLVGLSMTGYSGDSTAHCAPKFPPNGYLQSCGQSSCETTSKPRQLSLSFGGASNVPRTALHSHLFFLTTTTTDTTATSTQEEEEEGRRCRPE
jgi:hypothetical protein